MSRLLTVVRALASIAAIAPFASPIRAVDYELDRAASVFAVVTHKEGIASGLAHNHLVVAAAVAVSELAFDAADLASARLAVEVATDGLIVDRRADQLRWGPRLVELGLLPETPGEVSEGSREKIARDMLAGGQLDAARFPKISARLVALARRGDPTARVALPWTATIEIGLHGTTVRKEAVARIAVVEGRLRAEAVVEARFRDFGIEPYSGVLGTVRNQDLFHLFVALEATPKQP